MENNKPTAADIMAMRMNGGATFSIGKDNLNGTSPQEHLQKMFKDTGVEIGQVVTQVQEPYVVIYAWVAKQPEPQPKQPSTNGKQLHF